MKCRSILDAIGETPLVRLSSFLPRSHVSLYAKLEDINPGGSVKDRTAYGLISMAEKDGTLKHGGSIVESTSGNLGLALSMICAVKGYTFISVLDPKTPESNLNLIKAYGAKVEIVTETDETGSYQRPRIKRAKDIASSMPNCINLDQYNNPASRVVHYQTTGPEIYNDLEGRVDVLVGAVSTGGHLCGTAEYLKKKIPNIIVIGVEPEGSVIFGGNYAAYKQNGTGLSFRPGNYMPEYIDIEMKVSDKDAFLMARELAKKEGILAGGSSGGVLHIALEYAKNLKKKSTIVAIFPDGGAKYFDTVYSDKWMKDNKFL